MLFNRPVGVGEAVRGRVILERPLAYTDALTLSHRTTFLPSSSRPSTSRRRRRTGTPTGSRGSAGTGSRPRGPAGRHVHRALARRVPPARQGGQPGRHLERGGNVPPDHVTPPVWATWWFRSAAAALRRGARRARARPPAPERTARHRPQGGPRRPDGAPSHEDPRLPGFEVTRGLPADVRGRGRLLRLPSRWTRPAPSSASRRGRLGKGDARGDDRGPREADGPAPHHPDGRWVIWPVQRRAAAARHSLEPMVCYLLVLSLCALASLISVTCLVECRRQETGLRLLHFSRGCAS